MNRAGFGNVNGTQLFYEVAGKGETVVLIHGLCLDLRMWDDQVPALSEHYCVLRYDVRGFGKSGVPSGPFRHADDLHALLEHLDLGAAHIVGLSMGGRIALHHALIYPDATRSLVLVDSALDGFDWSREWEDSLDAIEAYAQVFGAAAGNGMWLKHELFATARTNERCNTKLAAIVNDCPGWNWVNDTPAMGIDPPAGLRLASVTAPTLVVVGENDLPDFARIADKLAAEIPHAQKAVLCGAGHMSNMERAPEFNTLLLDFLQAQNPQGS